VQLKAAGLNGWVTEYRFKPPRRWRFDLAWVEQKVALEIEGGVWNYGRHVRASGFVKDVYKYNEAAIMGWKVIRATTDMVDSGEAIEYLKRALSK